MAAKQKLTLGSVVWSIVLIAVIVLVSALTINVVASVKKETADKAAAGTGSQKQDQTDTGGKVIDIDDPPTGSATAKVTPPEITFAKLELPAEYPEEQHIAPVGTWSEPYQRITPNQYPDKYEQNFRALGQVYVMYDDDPKTVQKFGRGLPPVKPSKATCTSFRLRAAEHHAEPVVVMSKWMEKGLARQARGEK